MTCAVKGASILAEGAPADSAASDALPKKNKYSVTPYADYRKLLELKDLDYVTIATPEDWHSQMTIDALDAGLAVYCEKPLTHSVPEGLAVRKKQRETQLPLQVGVQSTADDSFSSAAKAIEEGVLGQVVQAQIEYVRRYGEQGPWRVPGLQEDMPKPSDLIWNDWLGDCAEGALESPSLFRVAELFMLQRRNCHGPVYPSTDCAS